MDRDIPKAPFAARPGQGMLRTLMGDVRKLLDTQSALVIDVEFETPRALLIVLKITGPTGSAQTGAITTRIGVDRGQTDEETVNSTGYERAVLARSVSVTVQNTAAGGATIDVKAIVVPLSITASADLFGSSAFGTDLIVDPNLGASVYQPVQAPLTTFSQFFGVATLGCTIYNKSPAGRSLYVVLGQANPLVAPVASLTNFTIIIGPNSYWESPSDWHGFSLSGIWDGAGLGGGVDFAQITFRT